MRPLQARGSHQPGADATVKVVLVASGFPDATLTILRREFVKVASIFPDATLTTFSWRGWLVHSDFRKVNRNFV